MMKFVITKFVLTLTKFVITEFAIRYELGRLLLLWSDF